MHADGVDMWLMGAGFIGGVADGSVAPLIIYLIGRMFYNIGLVGLVQLQLLVCSPTTFTRLIYMWF